MTQNTFSQETLNQAVEVIKNNESLIKEMQVKSESMSIDEVAQQLLIDKFGLAQIEAKEIIEDIHAGISDFDTQFKAGITNDQLTIADQLNEMTKSMTEQERTTNLVNVLTALQFIGKDNVTDEDITNAQNANATMSIDELTSAIEVHMNNNISLDKLAEAVKENIDTESLAIIAQQIELNKDDYRFMTAIWLYVAQREGNVNFSNSEISMSATMIGTLAGASIETIIATNQFTNGKIELSRWQTIMKWILGTVIGLAIFATSMLVIGVIAAIPLIAIMTTISTGWFALIIGVAIALYISDKLSNISTNLFLSTMGSLSKFYDKYIVVVTSKIQSLIGSIKSWVENKKNSEQTRTAPVGEPVTEPQQPVVSNDHETERPAMA